MSRRNLASAVRGVGVAILCGYWAWALLASPDSRMVLDGRIGLPLLGLGIPGGVFLIAAPLVGLAAFLVSWSRGRPKLPSIASLPAALILNAFRCLKIHDPGLSYVTAALAVAGTALAAWSWFCSRPIRGSRVSTGNVLAVIGLAAAAGIEGILVLFLVPWALRGDLPGGMNNYPFGPAVRGILFADLTGLERGGGPDRKSLRGLRLEGADLSRSNFKGADLRGARLLRARLYKANLEGADLRDALLTGAKLSFACLKDADLSGAELSGMYSIGIDLRGAILRGARHHVQSLHYADGRGMDLTSAAMVSAACFGADFRGAIFRDADLSGARLIRTRFDDADLSGANLSNADVEQATFRGAILTGTDLSGAKKLSLDALAAAATLRGARLDAPLLEELKRRNPGLF